MLTRRELLVLLLGFVLTLPAVTTRIYASDEVQYFVWLRSVAFDHDVDFENDYQHFYQLPAFHYDGFYATFLDDAKRNEAGRRLNHAPVGSAVMWAPFYAVGHVVALVTGAPVDGFSQPYIAAVAYGSACYGFLGVLLSISIARRIVGRGLTAAAVILVGTPLIFYIYISPPMSHANSAFAVSLFLWIWLRARERWNPGDLALLGATGALMAMVREQDAAFMAGPALDFLWWAYKRRPGVSWVAGRAAAIAAAYGIAYLPQLAGYLMLTGHPSPAEYVSRKMYWTAPYAWLVLFSPEHGLFAWTPLVLVALAGLVLLALGRVRDVSPDAAWLGRLALVMVLLQVYVAGAVASWSVAGAFGQRRFVSLTPLLVVGLAALFVALSSVRARSARRMATVLVLLCVWWNLGLMAQFGTNTMDRQRLTLGQNAWTTFVVLPATAPGLAWRYLTDRRSFYGQPRQ